MDNLYDLEGNLKVIVKVTFKDKEINKEFTEKNPEVLNYLPTYNEMIFKLNEVSSKTLIGMISILNISEDGFKADLNVKRFGDNS